MQGLVSLQDYQLAGMDGAPGAFPGIAGMNESDLQDVVKALEAGSLTGQSVLNSQNASGAALKVESLDKTLKHITFTENDIKLWKRIPKLPAYNTVEEFNQLVDYGSDTGGFNREGELPQEEDSKYVRRAQLIKYLGVTKSVAHPMTLVTPAHGPVIQREIKNGSMWILRKLNRSLTMADSSMIEEEFNGLYAQHQGNDSFATLQEYMDSEVIVDMRGAALTEAKIEAASEGIIENFGVGTELFMPPKVKSNFVNAFYSKKLIQPNTQQVSNGIVGQNVQKFESNYGTIDLTWDIFLNREKSRTLSSLATSNRAPAVPTASAIAPVAATVTNTKWAASDAGAYFYAVAAFNRFGVSALTSMSGSASTVVTNGAIDLTFTAGAGANPTSGYIIYRSQVSAASAAASTYYPLFKVSTTQLAAGYDGGAAGKVRDLNRFMPNTDQAFLIQNDEEVWAFRQLAPLMKMDLAIVSPAFRFMVLLYGTPLLFAPKKVVRFINIGAA